MAYTIPGTFRYAAIEDDLPRFQLTGREGQTRKVAFVEVVDIPPAIPFDRPLMSSPEWTYTYGVEGEAGRRTTIFEWLPPKFDPSGKHHVRIKVGRTTIFSLVFATPTGGETRPRAWFEECVTGFQIEEAPEDLILDLLMFDHQARCRDERVLGGIVAAELGLFFQRISAGGAR